MVQDFAFLPECVRHMPRLACKTLKQASRPWEPPVFVQLASPDVPEFYHVEMRGLVKKATLKDAMSCYKRFRQKYSSRFFEIRLGIDLNVTGRDGHGEQPDIISANDIISVTRAKHLLIRSPGYYGTSERHPAAAAAEYINSQFGSSGTATSTKDSGGDIGCTAVYLAAMEGRLDIVRGLIEFLYADAEARESGGRTSVYVSALATWRSCAISSERGVRGIRRE